MILDALIGLKDATEVQYSMLINTFKKMELVLRLFILIKVINTHVSVRIAHLAWFKK
jgi:hypothetical protein